MTAIAFLGTPEAAVPSLRALREVCEIRVLITRPDRAQGRSKTPVPPPVKQAGIELGLSVAQPTDNHELVDALHNAGPLDLAVLVAFGMLIPPAALAIPRLGFINAHFSLLPRWRGAAPVERAIMAGDDLTGVTLIQMDEGLDTGPVLGVSEVEIAPDHTGGDLKGQLSREAARSLAEVVPLLTDMTWSPTPQSEDGVTSAPSIGKEEAHLDFSRPAAELERIVRALNPRPGAFARHRSGRIKIWRVKIWRASPASLDQLEVGELSSQDDSLIVGCGQGALEVIELQPAGRNPMSGSAWARGRRGALGTLA